MKHAVIFAHPRPASLNASIAHAYVATARQLDHETILRDLYAIDFDPRLGPDELPNGTPPRFGDDVSSERSLLADVDVFAFVYPLWFNAPPAMLKGYVDRVFGLGFGFNPTFGGTGPALDGRAMISFTTSGAPETWVNATGAMSALTTLFDRHLAAMCGLRILDHVHFGGIVPGMRRDVGDDILDRVRSVLEARFAADGAALP